jgi:hypothetical protein
MVHASSEVSHAAHPVVRELLQLCRETVWIYSTAMRDIVVEKLSDHFGQYLIYLRCTCGHIRRCYPATFAGMAGWDAKLADIVKRLRCTKCQQRLCTARTVALEKPRGLREER